MPDTKQERKMDADLKERWVEALLSGKYKQGHAALANLYDDVDGHAYDEAHYCCLGVLCEVAEVDYEPEDGIPDAHWMKSVGLSYGFAQKLASLNDTGRNFDVIARRIEEEA